AGFEKATPAPAVGGPAQVVQGKPGPAGTGIVSITTGAQPFKPGTAAAGKEVFTSKGCSSCHAIEGVSSATVGPNLTHIATQKYNNFPNDSEFLKQWIHNPGAAKPGTAMPNLGLTDQELDSVVTYLETLK
ncbi:MAG: cytochrome c, partial [Chloroflexota bacterium]|nr:cytochrome c [Chloroflexota bacterium]